MAAKENKKTKPVKAIKKVAKKEKKEIVVQKQEELFPAFQIAEILSISDFDFFIIKRKNDIKDSDLLTIYQFKQMYTETIEEGR